MNSLNENNNSEENPAVSKVINGEYFLRTSMLPKNTKFISIIDSNKIERIPDDIDTFTKLENLVINNQKLKSLPNTIGNLRNLHTLDLKNNSLNNLPAEIGRLRNLKYLDISNNSFETLPFHLIELFRQNPKIQFKYNNNRIENIHPILREYLETRYTIQNIYNDSQNVHNTAIQSNIRFSIYNILNDYNILIKNGLDLNEKNNYEKATQVIFEEILNDKDLDELDEKFKQTTTLYYNDIKTILLEYCEDNCVHSEFKFTFKYILFYVWYRINHCELFINLLSNNNIKKNNLELDKNIKEIKIELKKVLIEEMNDSACKCFTGRVSRLINVLNGFYNDVQVKINQKEQYANVIIAIRKKLMNDNIYTNEKFKEEALKQFRLLNASEEDIKEWIYDPLNE